MFDLARRAGFGGVARFGPSGTQAAGGPFGFPAGASALYLMDVERQNLLRYSEDFGQAAWTKASITIAARDAVAPDGSSFGARLTAGAANATMLQTVSGLTGTHTLSLWLQRVTGSGDVQLTLDGGSAWITVSVTGSWARVSITGAPSSVGVRLVASGDAVRAFGAMLNAGSVALVYAATTHKQLVYDYSGNGNDAYLGSAGGAAINPIHKYLWLPGTTGNYASSPDTAATRITGDLDLRAQIVPQTWTPTDVQTIVSKYAPTGDMRSYRLIIRTDGALQIQWSEDGAALSTHGSTEAVPASDGEGIWVRVTVDVDDGAGGREVKFYTSPDGVAWTQLGLTAVGPATSIVSNTAPLAVGSYGPGNGNFFAGVIRRAQIYDGIGGTLAADFNPADAPGDVSQFYSVTTGELWTINSASYANTNDPAWTGEGLMFDGVDDSARAAGRDATVDAASVFAAAMPNVADATQRRLIGTNQSGNNNGLGISVISGSARIQRGDGSAAANLPGGANLAPADEPLFLSASADVESAEAYNDGVEVGSVAGPYSPRNGDIAIGANFNAYDFGYFNGPMFVLGWYGRKLSAAEHAQAYRAAKHLLAQRGVTL